LKSKSKYKFIVEISKPNLNYYTICLISSVKTKSQIFNLPTWSPGSYLIRDYSTHIHDFFVTDLIGNSVSFVKINLSSWKIFSNQKEIKIHYKVYAFEQTVRTNFLDTEYGFINPPSTFLYPDNNLQVPVELEFQLNSNFNFIYTALEKNKDIFFAQDFDTLYDSPIQLSNRKSIPFIASTCKHEIIIEGDILLSLQKKLIGDLIKIIEFEIDLMKINPNQYYLFILHLNPGSYGGLEHAQSSVNTFDPHKLHDEFEYLKLLGLLAHEYFHLWNAKRIRPIELNPFDYQNPNLTNELWIVEGITSFYDNYIMLRTNFFNKEDYLHEISLDYNRLENSEGELSMSLEESSFTAWNKFYKQSANSHNTGISYYVKGSILVLCMVIFILKKTSAKHNFTEILIALYEKFYIQQNRGFTKKEFFETAKSVTGLDLKKEFDSYLTEKIRIPLNNYLAYLGVKRISTLSKNDLGFDLENKSGKYYISKIYKQLKVKDTDINLQDELISINNIRYESDKIEFIKARIKKNSVIKLILSRRGKIIQRNLKMNTFKNHKIVLEKTEDVNILQLRKAFFGE
jgi:predicted metalloprotease with PDZ domain